MGTVLWYACKVSVNADHRAGNPFDVRWSLSTQVRDGTIYYDFNQQKWDLRFVAVANASDVRVEVPSTRSVRSDSLSATR